MTSLRPLISRVNFSIACWVITAPCASGVYGEPPLTPYEANDSFFYHLSASKIFNFSCHETTFVLISVIFVVIEDIELLNVVIELWNSVTFELKVVFTVVSLEIVSFDRVKILVTTFSLSGASSGNSAIMIISFRAILFIFFFIFFIRISMDFY